MTRLWPRGEIIVVEAQSDGLPARFQWRGSWHEVSYIAKRWRARTNWWFATGDTAREYVKLITADGLLCVLFRDQHDGAWYCARVFD